MGNKTTLGWRELQQIRPSVEAQIAAGRSRTAILEELCQKHFDRPRLAMLVGGIPEPHLKARYASLNARLFWLLVLTGIFQTIPKFEILLPAVLQHSVALMILVPLALLIPSVNWLIASQVAQFYGGVYALATLIGIIDLLEGRTPPRFLGEVGLLAVVAWIAIDVILAALIIRAAHTIRKRVFPYWGLLGPERDPSGNYAFQ